MVIWHPQPRELREAGTWEKKAAAHRQLPSRACSGFQLQRASLQPSHSPRSLWNWSINSSKTRQSSKPWEEDGRVNRQQESHIHKKCPHILLVNVSVGKHSVSLTTASEQEASCQGSCRAMVVGGLSRHPGSPTGPPIPTRPQVVLCLVERWHHRPVPCLLPRMQPGPIKQTGIWKEFNTCPCRGHQTMEWVSL